MASVIGERFYRNVRFDGVYKRIYPACSSDATWAGKGHYRTYQGDVWQEVVAHNPFLQLRLLSEKIATLVTSEPVPAVVGIAISGGPLRAT